MRSVCYVKFIRILSYIGVLLNHLLTVFLPHYISQRYSFCLSTYWHKARPILPIKRMFESLLPGIHNGSL
jgi:hypothetical protein